VTEGGYSGQAPGREPFTQVKRLPDPARPATKGLAGREAATISEPWERLNFTSFIPNCRPHSEQKSEILLGNSALRHRSLLNFHKLWYNSTQ
jgi:hypothetical protein